VRLNYHHLHYFYLVAREGSVSAVAQKLKVSQSAVTIQLKKLSEQLGVSLLQRSGRGVALTEDGRRILEYADSIFKTGDELVETLREKGRPRQRQLVIGATGGLSKNLQLHLIEPFLNNPNIELQVVVGDLEHLLSRLRDHQLDLVITHQFPAISHQRSLKISEIGKSSYVIAKHKSLELPSKAPLFLSVSGTGAHLQILKGLRSDFRVQGVVEDVALIRAILMSAKSCVFVPKIAIEGEIKSKTAVILKEYRHLSELFYAVERITDHENESIQRAIRSALKSDFIS
jgi:LysR family transcriptional regulator, transcriptional activator of nhaA